MIGKPVQHAQRDVLLAVLKSAQVRAVQPYGRRDVDLALGAALSQRAQACADFGQSLRVDLHMLTIEHIERRL